MTERLQVGNVDAVSQVPSWFDKACPERSARPFESLRANANCDTVSLMRGEKRQVKVDVKILSAYAEDHGLCPWMNA